MRSPRPRVVVVGSLNIDYIASVDVLPAPGQTVAALKLIRRFGGKGANQAIAAARQGALVQMIGCVGADDEGQAYRRRLKQEGIDASKLVNSRRALTGSALIAVDNHGENTIIVAPGANAELGSKEIATTRLFVPRPDAILLQFEIPMASVRAAVVSSNRAGVPVVLNPSPLRAGFPWGKCVLDTLIVNAGEADAIFGLDCKAIARCSSAWKEAIDRHQINQLIVTRGAQSSVCVSATEYFEVPTLKIKPIDTVGAGDAFAGTFVACRARGMDLRQAIRWANCAGALTTLESGAQEAMPNHAATSRAVRRLV